MALLHGFELRSARARWWRHGGGDGSGADAVQHADGGEELKQKGAVHLGGLRLLLGERRLLLVRPLAMPERAVGLEHVVEHRVVVVKEVRWAWNWLLNEGTCQEHPR